MKLKLFALFLALVSSFAVAQTPAAFPSPPPPAAQPAQAANWPVLRVAVDATYKPFTYKTSDGRLTGFDVHIAQALCNELRRRCVFVEQVWDGMIPGLLARKYDVIISSMSITDERRRVVDFTDKYYSTPSGIVVRTGTPFTGPASLRGKRIGVLKGSTQERFALGELRPAGVIIVPYDAQNQVYLDIQSGRLDGTVADRVEVTAGFLSKPEGRGFGFVGPELRDRRYFGDGMGIALRRGQDELRTQLNNAIRAIRANGTYDRIARLYFDFDIYGD
ncbi:MAG: ABC transporter substrate-binding protein [Serpentinimonas sp.]|nr:ABC transporter substrate-binding protein [Serpentinimonas sp.]